MNKIYTIENIDCANCAAKIERLIQNLPEVEEASITFTTKQLRVTAENPDSLVDKMMQLANSIENGILITERKRISAKKRSSIENEERFKKEAHSHNEEMCCGHGDCCSGCHEHAEHGCTVPHGHDCAGHDCMEGSSRHIHEEAKAELPREKKRKLSDLHFIGAGAVLFAVGLISESVGMSEMISTGFFLLAYLILGGEILRTAIKNIGKGQIFDENFLMSIATVGAIVIQEYPEAVGVMLFFRIGEYFEEKAVERSRSQIMDAVDLRPETVHLVISGSENTKEIPAEEAQIGDILLVKPGDRIPLDGIVFEGETRIDTSPITGEPVPIKAVIGTAVTSGCINTSGAIKIKTEKTLENSMVTRILESVENAAASKPKLDKFITRFAKVYTPFVVVLAIATAVIPSLVTGNWEHWVYTALTFLVISCPCALVLSVPLAFFSGIGAGSKQGILFKGGVALEALKNVKAVVMDKTGTLTKGEFTVQNVICTGELITYMTSGVTADVSNNHGQIDGNGEDSKVLAGMNARPKGISKQDVEKYLLYLAASCELHSTHPIGASILEAAKKYGVEPKRPQSVSEEAGKGIIAKMEQGIVLCGNRKLLTEAGVDLSGYENNAVGSEVLLAINNNFVGALVVSDSVKADSKAAIDSLKSMGIATAMLTGDGEESANAVAKATGVEKVFAKLLPDDKLRILMGIREESGSVMFVGDGINDAPVLAGADVGAAMGSGADAAIEAADVVFMTSVMEAVPNSIAIAKATGKIAMQNVIFALSIKALVMILGIAGMASMWMAVFADSGVAMLCVINSVRILYKK